MEQPAAPTLRFVANSIVVPGDRIGTIREVISGVGTYVRGGHVHASRVGRMELQVQEKQETEGSNKKQEQKQGELPSIIPAFTVVVVPLSKKTNTTAAAALIATNNKSVFVPSDYVLRIGQIVVARVLRLQQQQSVHLEIVACAPLSAAAAAAADADCPILPVPVQGLLRREDVRAAAAVGTDQYASTSSSPMAELQDCFRPHDILLCRILSLGDSVRRPYLVSTAEPSLGVIHAVCSSCSSSHPLQPVQWNEMICPVTGKTELRKCARPPSSSSKKA